MKKLSIILGTTLPIVLIGIITPICILATRNCNNTVSADKQTIDEINNVLEENKPNIKTMYQLVKYVDLTLDIDLEGRDAQGSDQIVWDEEANVVFTLNSNNNISYAPSTYKLNSKKHKIWKMVSYESSNGKIEEFDKNSEYGQYLRKTSANSNDLTKISFSCPLDVGYNTGFELTYKNSTTITGENAAVTINTNACKLIIDGTTSHIDHYGHANSLNISGFSDSHKYNEYGTVDGNAVLTTKVDFVAQPGSSTNTVYINDSNAEVTIVKKDDEVGLIGTVTTSKDDINPKEKTKGLEGIAEEEQPDFPGKQPEPTTRYAGGIGTVKSPFVITLPEHLVHASEDVNSSTLSTSNTLNFVVNNDIDMAQTGAFTPIGSSSNPFYGTFNGNNYTINNLTISGPTGEETTGANSYSALFGKVCGTRNEHFDTKEEMWDDDSKEIIAENMDESKYTSSIKNIYIENITNNNSNNTKFVAGIVGQAQNVYMPNLHVLSGTINGCKHMGGLVGSMDGCVLLYSSTGKDLTVHANYYNVGGLVGSARYDTSLSGTYGDAIIDCVNYANVVCEKNSDGNMAGILGWNQRDYSTTIIEGCENYGKIQAKHATTSGGVASPAGICSNAACVYVFKDCINHAQQDGTPTIEIEDGYYSKYCSGIACYCSPIMINCKNEALVKGDSKAMAGILAQEYGDVTSSSLQLTNCKNTGTITNAATQTGSTTGSIIAGGSSIVLTNETYENVAKLAEAIGTTSTLRSVELKNVTVTDKTGGLSLPAGVQNFTSNTKVCEYLDINTDCTTMTTEMVDTEIKITGDNTKTSLYSNGSNTKISIADGTIINNVTISGSGDTVENSGTILNSLYIKFKAKEAINKSTGLINNVRFDAQPQDDVEAEKDKTFTNEGTIASTTSHTFYASSFSVPQYEINPTILNKGTISCDPGTSPTYLFLWNAPGTFTLENFNGSSFSTTATEGKVYYLYDNENQFNIKYHDGAKWYRGEAEQSWDSLKGNRVTVTHIDD